MLKISYWNFELYWELGFGHWEFLTYLSCHCEPRKQADFEY